MIAGAKLRNHERFGTGASDVLFFAVHKAADACRRIYAEWVRLTWPLTGRSQEMRIIQAAISGRVRRESSSTARLVSGRVESPAKHCHRWRRRVTKPVGRWEHRRRGSSPRRVRAVGGLGRSATRLLVGPRCARIADNVSPGAKAVVGVDDVHLLDDLSIFVLHQIVQRGPRAGADGSRWRADFPRRRRRLWNGGQFERLDLQPLSREETATLVSASLGGSVDPDALRRLWG